MESTAITAFAGVFGSLVGGSAMVATALVTHRLQTKRELMRAEIRKRESLYGEFISECSKLFMDALVHTLDKPEPMLPVYALLNRIRLSASDAVLAEAEQMLRRITEQYFSPIYSLDEMRTLIRSGSNADPLKPFGEACRSELKLMQACV